MTRGVAPAWDARPRRKRQHARDHKGVRRFLGVWGRQGTVPLRRGSGGPHLGQAHQQAVEFAFRAVGVAFEAADLVAEPLQGGVGPGSGVSMPQRGVELS